MAVYRLSDTLYTAPQITAETVAEIAQLGIQTLICNRPDDEEAGQPSFEQVKQWLAQSGIRHFVYQAATMPQINGAFAAEFAQAAADAPVLAYCRTGTRSSLLWAIGQAAQGKDTDELIEHVRKASNGNIDLNVQRDKIAQNQAQ